MAHCRCVPQARLVGIELNPGPMTDVGVMTPSTPISPSFYDDLLHSIYSFLHSGEIMAPYRDVVTAARTCHRWYDAASTMKIPYNEGRSAFFRTLRQNWFNEIPKMTQSRLGNLVPTIHCRNELRPANMLLILNAIQFSQRMSHLHTLALSLNVNANDSILNHNQVKLMQSFRLPPNLRDLSLFLNASQYSGWNQDDELALLSSDQKILERDHTFQEIQTMMRTLAQAAHVPQIIDDQQQATSTSSITGTVDQTCRLIRLEIQLSVRDHRYRYLDDVVLPSCALTPWSRIDSLRHLIVDQPSRQCVDLMRTMAQLHRIDGLATESLLKRFIYGEGQHLIESSTVATIASNLPRLEFYEFKNASSLMMELIGTHFSELTHLECEMTEDPTIDSLLSKLKHLISLKCTVNKLLLLASNLLTSILTHSHQLRHLSLQHPSLTPGDLAAFLPRMLQLESLTLIKCQCITTLSWSKASPSSLVRLNLVTLPIVSSSELVHIQHIRNVDLKHCDREWPEEEVPPDAPLVGIELNPGPTATTSSSSFKSVTASSRVYTDVIHMIYSFVHDGTLIMPTPAASLAWQDASTVTISVTDGKIHTRAPPPINLAHRRFVSLASTSKTWYDAARTMKCISTSDTDQLFDPRPNEMKISQISSLVQSQLRNCMTVLHYPYQKCQLLLSHLSEIDLAQSMPHLTSLHLRIELLDDAATRVGPFDTTDLRLAFPPSLTALGLIFYSTHPWTFRLMDESHETSPRVNQKFVNLLRVTANTLGIVVASSCPHLSYLSIEYPALGQGDYRYLPAFALKPFSTLSTLTHLSIYNLSYLCVDLVRTMSQLKRLDGFGYDGREFGRLMNGPQLKEDNVTNTNNEQLLQLPPLTHFTIHHAKESQYRQIARFIHLTSLTLHHCSDDPGPSLLSHLSELISIDFKNGARDSLRGDILLPSIISYAPQIRHLKLEDIYLSDKILRETISQLLSLESLTLVCYHNQEDQPRFAFLDVIPPSLARFELINPNPRINQEEFDRIKKVSHRVKLMGCDPPPIMTVPPAAPLVGIELNPGPITSSSQLIYDDILHTIYSFIDYTASSLIANSPFAQILPCSYLELLHPARTCRLWYHAAESMRTNHANKNISSNSVTHDISFLSLSYDQLLLLSTSRLRHIVMRIRYEPKESQERQYILIHLHQMHFASRMAHLQHLSMQFYFDSKNLIDLVHPAAKFRYPASLQSVEFVFVTNDQIPLSRTGNETDTINELTYSCHEHVNALMRLLMPSLQLSSCHNLARMDLRLLARDVLYRIGQDMPILRHLPASVMEPLLSLTSSLTDLHPHLITLQAADVIRRMSHLRRIDLKHNNEATLRRFIEGEQTQSNSELTHFEWTRATVGALQLMARLIHLTELRLSAPLVDPGESLLAHLPHLRHFVLTQSQATQSAYLESIAKHASQLQHFVLVNTAVHSSLVDEEQLSTFLASMTDLKSLTLIQAVGLSDWSFVNAAPSSLTSLVVRSTNVEYDSLVKLMRTSVRTQSIQLSEGRPSGKRLLTRKGINFFIPKPLHLYDDIMRSILSFFCGLRNRQFIALASTSRQWLSVAGKMKPPFEDLGEKEQVRSIAQVERIAQSPLRNLVNSLRVTPKQNVYSVISELNGISLAARMSHLVQLNLSILLDDGHAVQMQQLILPASLTYLTLEVHSPDKSFCLAQNEEENRVEQQASTIYTRMCAMYRMFGERVQTSEIQLCTLILCFTSDYKPAVVGPAFLPAAALEPFTLIQSLTHLSIPRRASLQCIELMRTMKQLKQVDGFSTTYKDFERLIRGSPRSDNNECIPLTYYQVSGATGSWLCLLADITTLTNLELHFSAFDPGEILFSRLPHLQRLEITFLELTVPNVATVLISIAKHAPQLRDLSITSRLLRDERLIEFLPQMSQLELLTLTNYRNGYYPRFTFLDHIQPAFIQFKLIESPTLTLSECEVIHSFRRRVKFLGCHPAVVSPPAPRLVCIELNPGPMSTSSSQLQSLLLGHCFGITHLAPLPYLGMGSLPITKEEQSVVVQQMKTIRSPIEMFFSPKNIPPKPLVGIELNPGPSVAQSLYPDVLHSIIAFLNVDQILQKPRYSRLTWCRDFIGASMVSKSWGAAAESMKFTPSSFIDDPEVDCSDRPLLKEAHLRLLCQSRVRRSVHRVRFSDWAGRSYISLTNFIRLCLEIDFANRLSHIQRLDLKVEVQEDDVKYPDTFRLPVSLRHLKLEFEVDNYSGCEDESDHNFQCHRANRISAAMLMFAECVKRSCHQLEILELISPQAEGRWPRLNEGALQPWTTLFSLRHLILDQPTLQCVDLARTMTQLHRIDGIVGSQLRRFVFGAQSSDVTQGIVPSGPSSLPPLVTFQCQAGMSDKALLPLIHFSSLTDIRFHNLSPILIEQVCFGKNLRRICISTASFKSSQDILDALLTSAPQLEFIELRYWSGSGFIRFLTKMMQLVCMTIEEESYVRNLAHPEKFGQGTLIEDGEHVENTWTQTIRTIKIHQYDKWKQQQEELHAIISAPAPRLVGIELNPGPPQVNETTLSSSFASPATLFADGLAIVLSYLHHVDWLSSSRISHHWFHIAATMHSRQLTRYYDGSCTLCQYQSGCFDIDPKEFPHLLTEYQTISPEVTWSRLTSVSSAEERKWNLAPHHLTHSRLILYQ